MTQRYKTDILVIGAGPAGLSAVFQCGLLGLSCHVIEALPEIGGQCAALYPEKPIFDIPAFPAIAAGALIARLARQAALFTPVYHLGTQAQSLSCFTEGDASGWRVGTDRGGSVDARAIIIAAGKGAFRANKPPFCADSPCEGHSIFYSVRSPAAFAGKRVVIAGGGDSAVDWALILQPIAQSVTLVHRRAKFRAAPASLATLRTHVQTGAIHMIVPAQLSGIGSQANRLDYVEITYEDGSKATIPADILLPFYGLASDTQALSDWGLTWEGAHLRVEPTTCMTNRPQIYAIGDIATYPHKRPLILTGFAESASAAHAALRALDPATDTHAAYSTSRRDDPLFVALPVE